jgi:hypothetical protein
LARLGAFARLGALARLGAFARLEALARLGALLLTGGLVVVCRLIASLLLRQDDLVILERSNTRFCERFPTFVQMRGVVK